MEWMDNDIELAHSIWKKATMQAEIQCFLGIAEMVSAYLIFLICIFLSSQIIGIGL